MLPLNLLKENMFFLSKHYVRAFSCHDCLLIQQDMFALSMDVEEHQFVVRKFLEV